MNNKVVFPIVLGVVCIIAAQLMGPTQPQANDQLFREVVVQAATSPVKAVEEPTEVPPQQGPGYVPSPPEVVSCQCEGHVTADEVRTIVSEELAKTRSTATTAQNQTTAAPSNPVSYGSAGVSTAGVYYTSAGYGSSPAVGSSYGSTGVQSVRSVQPVRRVVRTVAQPVTNVVQTVQTNQPVRTAVRRGLFFNRGVGSTCQMVNGVMTCN